MTKKKADHGLRNRITEMRVVHTDDLRDNAGNWRVHPGVQRSAMEGILSQVGIADALLAYTSERAGGALVLIDGHLRAEDFEGKWPVLILDVDDAEADILLTTHDPLSALAEMDGGKLSEVMAGLVGIEDGLANMMADLQTKADLAAMMEEVEAGFAGGEGGGDSGPAAKTKSADGTRQIAPVISIGQVATFERALRATGMAGRGAAVIRLCEFYLEHHDAS